MSPEDFLIWPCSTYCQRYQLPEFSHLSDDYQVIKYGTHEWIAFNNDPDVFLS